MSGTPKKQMERKRAALAAIKRCRGILKPKPGEKPFAEQWAEHKREEMELEDRHLH
jgi:hypothetical protein